MLPLEEVPSAANIYLGGLRYFGTGLSGVTLFVLHSYRYWVVGLIGAGILAAFPPAADLRGLRLVFFGLLPGGLCGNNRFTKPIKTGILKKRYLCAE